MLLCVDFQSVCICNYDVGLHIFVHMFALAYWGIESVYIIHDSDTRNNPPPKCLSKTNFQTNYDVMFSVLYCMS